jgi:hypothetical protein
MFGPIRSKIGLSASRGKMLLAPSESPTASDGRILHKRLAPPLICVGGDHFIPQPNLPGCLECRFGENHSWKALLVTQPYHFDTRSDVTCAPMP